MFKWINTVYFLIVTSMTSISFLRNILFDDVIIKNETLIYILVKKEMSQ